MKLRTRETVEKGRVEGERSTGGNNREGGSGMGGGWLPVVEAVVFGG